MILDADVSIRSALPFRINTRQSKIPYISIQHITLDDMHRGRSELQSILLLLLLLLLFINYQWLYTRWQCATMQIIMKYVFLLTETRRVGNPCADILQTYTVPEG